MKIQRMMIQLPASLKAKLDALRTQGTTASGYIRALLEREFTHSTKKGR
jgi:mannitol/fructose-specific phosphotransferase system IIA component